MDKHVEMGMLIQGKIAMMETPLIRMGAPPLARAKPAETATSVILRSVTTVTTPTMMGVIQTAQIQPAVMEF
jgi:hypothetical protein